MLAGEHRALLRATSGHPDIIIRVHPSLDRLAAWLPLYFSDQVEKGGRFVSGQTVQVGFGLLRLMETDEGDLLIQEPDFVSAPITWTEGASRCVRFLALQKAVCAELGVELNFPSLRQVLLAQAPTPGPDRFTLSRDPLASEGSGWALFADANAAMQLVSIYEAVLACPAIVPFLALPPGSAVKREAGRLAISAGDHRQSSDSNLFLSRLVTATI